MNTLKVQKITTNSDFTFLGLKPSLRLSKLQIDQLAHLYNLYSIKVECIDDEYVRMTGDISHTIIFKNFVFFRLWMRNVGYEYSESIFVNITFVISDDNSLNTYHDINSAEQAHLEEYNEYMQEEECKKIN